MATTKRTVEPDSTTGRAAQIRAALKAKGWTSRDVSVRAHLYSMGSSIYVEIKNPTVPLSPVERIANAHESIDRDQFGDILSGGNRFVSVRYSHEAHEALSKRTIAELVAASMDLAAASENSLIPIGATGYLLGRDHNGHGFSLWRDGHLQSAYELDTLAAHLAMRMQDAAA